MAFFGNQHFVPFFALSIMLIWCKFSSSQAIELSCKDVAQRVASRAKNAIEESSFGYYKNFGTWSYQGAMIYRGLWEIQSALSAAAGKHSQFFDLEPFLHHRLNFYQVSSIGIMNSLRKFFATFFCRKILINLATRFCTMNHCPTTDHQSFGLGYFPLEII